MASSCFSLPLSLFPSRSLTLRERKQGQREAPLLHKVKGQRSPAIGRSLTRPCVPPTPFLTPPTTTGRGLEKKTEKMARVLNDTPEKQSERDDPWTFYSVAPGPVTHTPVIHALGTWPQSSRDKQKQNVFPHRAHQWPFKCISYSAYITDARNFKLLQRLDRSPLVPQYCTKIETISTLFSFSDALNKLQALPSRHYQPRMLHRHLEQGNGLEANP